MNSRNIFSFFVALFVFWLPVMAFGQAPSYKPLVGIPGVADPGLNFGDYINALYALSISVAALLAVIKIVIAGMKYMLSDVVTSKSEAISDIQGSVFGLIIVISAVLILTVINPNLTKTEVFVDPVTNTPNSGAAPGGGGVVVATGYKYAKAGAVPTFKADCLAVAGSIYMLGDGNDVCYNKLPDATVTSLDSTFNVAIDPGTGEKYYPAADRAAVLKRFQTSHYPRLISGGADLNAIKTAKSASEVLLAVNLTNANDWIDRSNSTSFGATCEELQRASGKDTLVVRGTIPAGSYIACIVI